MGMFVITVDGKLEKGMKEAAEFFNVSEKTLRNWLKDDKLPVPPDTKQGTRTLRYFPDQYLEQAKDVLGV